MFDYKKPTTQLLGRYQPWHDGHTELFKRAFAKTNQVAILIRESDETESNPFTYQQRVKLIESALSKEGFVFKTHYDIIRVPNIVNITYGRDVGYAIEQEKLDASIEAISATKIRNEIL
jgi:nicotinamide mononucleotide adenylyltransferase